MTFLYGVVVLSMIVNAGVVLGSGESVHFPSMFNEMCFARTKKKYIDRVFRYLTSSKGMYKTGTGGGAKWRWCKTVTYIRTSGKVISLVRSSRW